MRGGCWLAPSWLRGWSPSLEGGRGYLGRKRGRGCGYAAHRLRGRGQAGAWGDHTAPSNSAEGGRLSIFREVTRFTGTMKNTTPGGLPGPLRGESLTAFKRFVSLKSPPHPPPSFARYAHLVVAGGRASHSFQLCIPPPSDLFAFRFVFDTLGRFVT